MYNELVRIRHPFSCRFLLQADHQLTPSEQQELLKKRKYGLEQAMLKDILCSVDVVSSSLRQLAVSVI